MPQKTYTPTRKTIKNIFALFVAGLLLFSMFSVSSCSVVSKPILVGFAAELTGHNSSLGVQGRNGAILAVETINRDGGVAGHSLELIVEDNLGTRQGVEDANQALIDAGAVAVVGYMTSVQAKHALETLPESEEDMIIISPTTSSSELSGLDDNLFCLAPNTIHQARAAAQIVQEYAQVKRAAVIYDQDNFVFTESFKQVFSEYFTANDGKIVSVFAFSSSADPDFHELANNIKTANPEGLLILASSVDTALIAQHVRLADSQTLIFASGWSHTEDLLLNGGNSVEGMYIVGLHDGNDQSPDYLDFKTRYEARFGNSPAFAASLAYESVMVLAEALRQTNGKPEGLKQALLAIQDFPVLQGEVSFDATGDVVRNVNLIRVQDGQFVSLGKY